ncbi:MAG: hypothetical protein WAV15_02480 [Minisyncoccia bacterium]
MPLENFLNTENSNQNIKEVEEAIIRGATDFGPVTRSDFLAEQEKKELQNRKKIEQLAELAPQFLSQVDECVVNYQAKHENEENSSEKLVKFKEYDDLVTQIRQAVELFLANIAQEEFVELLEHDINTISDLCKKVYEIDNTFPNLEFLDKEKFKEAVQKEIYENRGGEAMRAKFESVGRFSIVGNKQDGYFVVDQQGHEVVKQEIPAIGSVRKDSAVIVTYGGFFGDIKYRLFSAETGKLSKEYDNPIIPSVGNLWMVKHDNNIYILDKNAIILHKIGEYVPNDTKTRAVVRAGFGYNILLEDGTLMFEDETGFYVEESVSWGIHSSWSTGGKVSDDIILKPRKEGGKFRRLNKNLEVVAEGDSIEEVKKAAA